ncbi:hypothetical protein [Cellulomonas sp. IC4_254]|uniref:hypothetical protein n=1 Tax=Cellulomonas sp. IC4_254 TaxID=2714040 RepID=UPI00142232E8|nr:hypothetical protein [Cellulomonas sp. IC4_254]NHT16131.1 hypothetical protein [Cellulomonas sp. IC4_254]
MPGTSGNPDFGPADGSSRYATEVTSDPDSSRVRLRQALRRNAQLDLGTQHSWHVYLYPRARVKELADSDALKRLLLEAERLGLMELPTVHADVTLRDLAYFDDALASLRIEHAGATFAQDGSPGRVWLSGGTTAAWGGYGPRVDAWWSTIRDGSTIANKVAKLRNSGARRTHLYVELDQASEHGLAIAVGLSSALDEGAEPYTLPTLTPPEGVDELWLWPNGPSDGLRYTAEVGWRRVTFDGTVRAQAGPTS